MEELFVNFELILNDCPETTYPFIIACKDRTAPVDEERWTVAPVSEEEVQKLYEILKEYLESK